MPAAGVFTTNLAAAAPVTVSRAHLAASGGRAAAVIISSGNANAATGAGVRPTPAGCAPWWGRARRRRPPRPHLPDRTDRDPAAHDPIEAGIPRLLACPGRGPGGGRQAATAIMTTDVTRKEVLVEAAGFSVGAMAKGAAMLAPNMATMLAVLTTDATADPATSRTPFARRRRQLQPADGRRLHLDQRHCLVLASGRSAAPADPPPSPRR